MRATDNGIPAASSTSTFNINVNSAAPTASIAGPASPAVAKAQSFTFSATDVSSADRAAGYTWQINWGDGAAQSVSVRSVSKTLSHTYSKVGAFQVQVIATDKDGAASAPAIYKATVSGAARRRSIESRAQGAGGRRDGEGR